MMSVQKVRLGDLVEVVNDNEYEPLKNGLTKYVAGEHLESEKLHITRFGDIERDKEVIGSAFHRKFSKGHVLFGTRRAYLRKTGIVTFDGICANTTLVLKPKQNGLVEGLLPFIVRLEKFTKHAVNRSVGSTNPYVRWRDLAAFEFELPSEPEQLKIKETLWIIQNSIDSLENLLEKTKIYFISKRESLLTRGIGHDEFQKIKLNNLLQTKEVLIPTDWNVRKIKDIGEIDPDTINEKKYNHAEIEYVDISSIVNFKIKETEKIPLKKRPSRAQKILEKNDVIISTVRPYLKAFSIVEKNIENLVGSTGFIVIRCTNSIDSKWIFYFSQTHYFITYLTRLIQGSNYPAVSSRELANALIPYTNNLEEKEKIVTILSNINEQISQQQSHLTNLYALQDSILNSKLTKEKVIAQ